MNHEEAIRQKLVRFRPDEACRNGHWSLRLTSNGRCIACMAGQRRRRVSRAEGKGLVELTVRLVSQEDAERVQRLVDKLNAERVDLMLGLSHTAR